MQALGDALGGRIAFGVGELLYAGEGVIAPVVRVAHAEREVVKTRLVDVVVWTLVRH